MTTPKVTLVSWTPNPIELVLVLWNASKDEHPLLSVSDVMSDPALRAEAEALFWKVINQEIPIGEHVNFVFVLEGVSVSFREQMVRHRIGTTVGPRVGVDMVPELASSTFWSQSMRIQSMGRFADEGMYRVPESLKGKVVRPEAAPVAHEPAESLYHQTMKTIQDAYNVLVAAGVPMEDARDLIPLGATHRISWGLNLQSMLHIVGKRSCWILQAGLWAPVIEGMIDELAEKVSPMFRRLAAPPCIDHNDKFTGCVYRLENQRRLTGDDDHAPCPLYLVRDEDGQQRWRPELGVVARTAELQKGVVGEQPVHRAAELVERAERYRQLWAHDPWGWDL